MRFPNPFPFRLALLARRPRAVLLAAVFLLTTASTRADVTYFSNLDQSTTDLAPIDTTGNFSLAQSFLTDASASLFTLDNVTLRMGDASATGGNFQVSIWADTTSGSDTPNFPIAILSGSADPATAGDYIYDGTGLTLAPNTVYWVVAQVTAGSAAYNWAYTSSNTTTGAWPTLGWSQIDASSTPDWTPIQNTEPQLLSLTATPVPEPATTTAIVGVLMLGVATILRHRLLP